MYDNDQIDKKFARITAELEQLATAIDLRAANDPVWVSTGPAPHHALRLDTAELVLQCLREKHREAFAAAVSEVLTGEAIHITKRRAKRGD